MLQRFQLREQRLEARGVECVPVVVSREELPFGVTQRAWNIEDVARAYVFFSVAMKGLDGYMHRSLRRSRV